MGRSCCGMVVLVALMTSAAAAIEKTPTEVTARTPAPPAERTLPAVKVVQPAGSILPAVASGRQLALDSRRAFQRGLLPLADYLEHLAAAEEVEVRLVSASATDAEPVTTFALRAALQPRVDALRVAVQQMSGFRQPASANWEADLLLGKYLLAEAEAETAALMGDQTAVSAATQSQAVWARAHYVRRVFDAQVLGHATLPEVAQAITFLNVSPSWKRRALSETAAQTQRWNNTGAGIGRADQLLKSRVQLALWDAELPRSQTDRAVIQRGLNEVDQLTAQLFDAQQNYFQRGTATLADLSRTWQTRRQGHLLASWLEVDMPAASVQSHGRELDTLKQLAAATTDRRGRHAADVEYVRFLGFMNAADRADAESAAARNRSSGLSTPAGHRERR